MKPPKEGQIWKWNGLGQSFRVRIDRIHKSGSKTKIAFSWTSPALAAKLGHGNKGKWEKEDFVKWFEWIGDEKVIHSNETKCHKR